jgi:hypothetical protein
MEQLSEDKANHKEKKRDSVRKDLVPVAVLGMSLELLKGHGMHGGVLKLASLGIVGFSGILGPVVPLIPSGTRIEENIL